MRKVLIHVVPPLAVGVLVFLFSQWWTASRPEVQVYYSQRTASIPAGTTGKSDCFSEIRVWNPSKRAKAGDVRFTIRLSDVDGTATAGPVQTQEPRDYYEVLPVDGPQAAGNGAVSEAAAEGPIVKGAGFRARIQRLAPGSELVVPVWWRTSSRAPRVEVSGTCDQCTLREESSSRADAQLQSAQWLAVLNVAALAIAVAASSLAVVRGLAVREAIAALKRGRE